MTYTIKSYNDKANGFPLVPKHPRLLNLYGLRYLRNDELIEKYKLNWVELEAFTGLKIRNQSRLPVQIETSIANLDWQSYINKLCTAKWQTL